MRKTLKHLTRVVLLALVLSLMVHTKAQNPVILDQINHSFATQSENLPGESLYLQLDKTLYQPGETIWFAGYLRNPENLKQPGLSEVVYVNLKSKNGATVHSLKLLNRNGKVEGDIELDAALPQGDYEIEAYTRWQQNGKSPYFFRRDIRVEQLVRPRVMADVVFDKTYYEGGDKLRAEALLLSGLHEVISKISGECFLHVDGERIKTIPFASDQSGKSIIEADLPSFLPEGGVSLNFSFDYQDLVEEVESKVPYAAGTVDMRFFPEGGDMIAGQLARVAFLIHDNNGKSIDAEGYITDVDGNHVATFNTIIGGMGRFDISPQKDQSYLAVVTSPANVPGTFPLPAVLESGLSLRIESTDRNSARLMIQAPAQQQIFLTANVGKTLCFSKTVSVKQGVNEVEIETAGFPAGVARFTLFDATGDPQAERLVYIGFEDQLNVKFLAGQNVYEAGEEAQLDLFISDPHGNPVQGSFSLAVTDDKLLNASGVESSNIIAEMLLKPNIRGYVQNAARYFDRENPLAKQGLDLQLMTHGWRHFTWEEKPQDQLVATTNQPERPLVKGYFYEDTVTNRVGGLKIKVEEGSQKLKTNKDGSFQLEGLDLSEPVIITYKDINGNWSEYLLTEYTSELAIDIAVNYEFKEGEKSVLKTEENAQYMASGTASIKGRIIDAATVEPIPFASVQAEVNGRMINGAMADEAGYYTLKPLPPGRIDVLTSSMGYSPYTIRGVLTKSRQIIHLDIEVETNVAIIEEMTTEESPDATGTSRLQIGFEADQNHLLNPLMADPGYFGEADTVAPVAVQTSTKTRHEEVANTYTLDGIEVVWREPLVPIDQNITGRHYSLDDLEHAPRRSVEGAVSATPGVFSMDGEAGNVRGARNDQTVYYVDGVRVIGDANVPALGIAEIAVYVGGIPAEYGDCRGGVVEITTRGPDMYSSFESREKRREVINLPQLPVYHKVRSFPDFAESEKGSVSGDFRPTLLWVGDLQTDENGEASIRFTTSDAETDFRITLEGISESGVPAHAEAMITTYKKQGE